MPNFNLLCKLPNADKCLQISKSLAMIDAILMPEWEYRYYSFNSKWDTDEMMASMRDGSGEHYFALFNKHGLIIKGFEHQSKNEALGKSIFTEVPCEFSSFRKEPAFIIEDSTFCVWNKKIEGIWRSSSEYCSDELYLLKVFIEGAKGYARWAEEYYEREIPECIVEDIFNFKPLSKAMVKELNNDITIHDISEDIEEISYPCNK